MFVFAVSTSNGAHPPEVMAQFALDEMISVAPTAQGNAADEANKLRGLFYPVLVKACRTASLEERQAKIVDARSVLPQTKLVEDTVKELVATTSGSMHELHFKQEHALTRMRQVLNHHLATVIDIERKWNRDRLKKA